MAGYFYTVPIIDASVSSTYIEFKYLPRLGNLTFVINDINI